MSHEYLYIRQCQYIKGGGKGAGHLFRVAKCFDSENKSFEILLFVIIFRKNYKLLKICIKKIILISYILYYIKQ